MAEKQVVSTILVTSFIAMFVSVVISHEGYEYVNDTKGPSHWGSLNHEWIQCSIGKVQSPISIVKLTTDLLHSHETLSIEYRPLNASLHNRGHDVAVIWASSFGGGNITIDGKTFILQQMHWHYPSEHHIDGNKYAMETHLVHQSIDGMIVVIAILHQQGEDNAFLSGLENNIRQLGSMNPIDLGLVDAINVNLSLKSYYKYFGSLTTPPCTEGVIWIILDQVNTVSHKQIKLLQQTVDPGYQHNARPLQPLDRRIVLKLHN